jgi:hypothetical protein
MDSHLRGNDKAFYVNTIERLVSLDNPKATGWQPHSRRLWGWWEKNIPKLRLRLPPFFDDSQIHLL